MIQDSTGGRGRYLPATILLVSLVTVLPYLKISIANTFLVWGLEFLVLAYLWSIRKRDHGIGFADLVWLHLYVGWGLVCVARGMFIAEGYWEWRGLVGASFGLVMPIATYAFLDRDLVQRVFRGYWVYAAPLFVLLFPVIEKDAVGFYFALVPLLLLAIPTRNGIAATILLAIAGYVMVVDLGARSNVMKFALALALSQWLWLRFLVPTSVLFVVRRVLIAAPIVLFALGVSGVFNVFKMDEFIEGEFVAQKEYKGEEWNDDLKADTRTGLYEEVLASAQKHDSWLLGRSPARGNETELFAELAEITGKAERLSNEAAILNVFTWTGGVGVVLYGLLFMRASYLGLHRSNNVYCRLVALYTSARWAIAWFEDGNFFNLSYLTVWIGVGICLSPSMRRMSDAEVQAWFARVFSFRPLPGRGEVEIR